MSLLALTPEAATLMRELFTTCVVDPIVTAIAPERAELRASLVASHLLGLHVGRYLLEFDAIAGADAEAGAGVHHPAHVWHGP
ncbi:hypothetical protein [Streptomyces sp. NBC_00624]|uniref:TetR/AcrR family transcriptional regulator n=1 Tax=Streptomyces sp. NBC_00624 TaxID=2975791 RepID=UPI0030E2D890